MRIEHIFGYMSQSMKGFYLRAIGRRRNEAAIGLINLIYNLARYEQIARIEGWVVGMDPGGRNSRWSRRRRSPKPR